MSPQSDPSNTESTNVGGAAWLKFSLEHDSRFMRAAWYQVTENVELQAFSFSGATCPGYQTPRGEVSSGFLRNLTNSLLSFVQEKPILLLGLTDEIPPGLFADGLGSGIVCCRVSQKAESIQTGGDQTVKGSNGIRLLWETETPGQDSEVQYLLNVIQAKMDLYDPFSRAEVALQEAFGNTAVHEMFRTGLTNMVSVPIATETLFDSASSFPQHQGLAKRLNEILALPKTGAAHDRLTWAGTLMPFQQDGVQELLNNFRLLLADDMGLGKTIQVIAALRILLTRGEFTSCLVVAPASILDNWRREISIWAPEFTAIIIRGPKSERNWQWQSKKTVTLVSYDMLRAEYGAGRSPAFSRDWDVVVADEAQRIKNRNETSRALKDLPRDRSWALTGTPIENHEEELASILEFVDHDGKEIPPNYRPGPLLWERHRQLQLRRKKSEVLVDLPPKQITKVPIDLTRKQRASYDRAEKEGIVYLRSLGSEVGIQHILELITRLKQICNADFKTGESAKLADIEDRLGQLVAQGHRALIFSQYTSDTSGVAAAAKYLQEFEPLTLVGTVPTVDRPSIIERFKQSDRHKALILSLRVGGLGLNLQEASYVFHLDRWWNPAIERQAEDRSHRMGQKAKVNIIKYSCNNTIEQRIDEILTRKQELFDELVDDISLNLSARLTREELFGLFGLTGN